MSDLPADYPHRLMALPGKKRKIWVPRNITRIDSETSKTHGWQVVGRRPTKFFSDAVHGGKPADSLSVATAYLAALVAARPELTPGWSPQLLEGLIDQARASIANDVGVRLKQSEQHGSSIFVVVAAPPSRKFSSKQFYVGSANTFTMSKFEEMADKARATRVVMVQEHLARMTKTGSVYQQNNQPTKKRAEGVRQK